MLLSMTGFGEARGQTEAGAVTVEIRSVNNRHLKLSTRISDPHGAMEPELEQLIRGRVRRGTVQINVRIERPKRAEDYRLNLVALNSYREQLLEFAGVAPFDLSALLTLPGVVEESKPEAPDVAKQWPEIAKIVAEALEQFDASRAREGAAMAAELRSLAESVRTELDRIAARSPLLIEAHQKRLTERVQNLVREHEVTVEPSDLIREVAILADRSDVSEEIVRLRAHVDQYQEILGAKEESGGRKLEFVVQEMGREINTIGSKANDVEISRNVVEVKGTLEKIRELVQNVE